jgi:hypothetical protein
MNSLIGFVLSMMLALAPRADRARLRPIAEAIAAVAADRGEAATLVVVDFYERGFLAPRSVPFGLSAFARRLGKLTLRECAQLARDTLRRARRACGPRLEVRLGWYHSGRCAADGYSARQQRTAWRLLRHTARR